MIISGFTNHDQFRRVWEEAPSRRKKPPIIDSWTSMYIYTYRQNFKTSTRKNQTQKKQTQEGRGYNHFALLAKLLIKPTDFQFLLDNEGHKQKEKKKKKERIRVFSLALSLSLSLSRYRLLII
jgi:hypothetical protein